MTQVMNARELADGLPNLHCSGCKDHGPFAPEPQCMGIAQYDALRATPDREAVLEEAAIKCDDLARECETRLRDGPARSPRSCYRLAAKQIRALKSSPTDPVARCQSTKSEDGGSTSSRVPCDGVLFADGTMTGGCGEPCNFVMDTTDPVARAVEGEREACAKVADAIENLVSALKPLAAVPLVYPRRGSGPQEAQLEPGDQGPYIAADVVRARQLIQALTGREWSYAARDPKPEGSE